MFEDHWFDVLGKMLVPGSSRRNVLRGTAALAAGLLGGTLQGGVAADPCDRYFTKPKDRDFCRTKRRRCKNAGTNFCIVEGNPADPAKLATCCHRGDECCGRECCGKVDVGGESLAQKCCDKATSLCCPKEWECCPADAGGGTGCCDTTEGWSCCPGAGCVDRETDNDNCGTCGKVCRSDELCTFGNCVPSVPPCCGPGKTYCPDNTCYGCSQCVDTQTDAWNCGGCSNRCPSNQHCINGSCGCPPRATWCATAQLCIHENHTCCGRHWCNEIQICCDAEVEGGKWCYDYRTCP